MALRGFRASKVHVAIEDSGYHGNENGIFPLETEVKGGEMLVKAGSAMMVDLLSVRISQGESTPIYDEVF